MAKLFPDGKPHFNGMTKTIKPPGWQDPKPRLIAAIGRMAADAQARQPEGTLNV
jgi:predicted HAD superfamily Cof-like phosphohydrolase